MSLGDRITACAQGDFSGLTPFRVDGVRVGMVRPDIVDALAGLGGDVFQLRPGAVELAPGPAGFEERSRAVDGVLRRLAEDGLVPGWRDEAYAVGTAFAAPPLFAMERAAVPLFGVRAYGVHLNGTVETANGAAMWIARRALDKPTAPGKLDQVVAGGQPAGMSLIDNLVKESAEEASIPADLAGRAVPAGFVSYRTLRPEGLRHDVLFVYDLELPPDFRPVNADGEIADFRLWPIGRVLETVRDSDDFKFNCALVVIDFLVRRGVIAPEDPDYVDVVEGLRRAPRPD